jgi:antibiotic biosynthesis monooxygenase (ABM) superfamily enzyme
MQQTGWGVRPDTYTSAIGQRLTPTVIVARTARAGHERQFEQWLQRMTATAARQPGHVGSDLQPPGAQHPSEWVIVYQFADQPLLDRWLESPIRAELLADGAAFTEGEARVQRLAMGSGDNPVTAVASFLLRPGHQEAFEHGYDDLLDVIETFDGYLRAQLFPPVDAVQSETVIVFSFSSREELDLWLDSEERKAGLARLEEHIEGERQVNVIGGFGGWFSIGGPTRVKTWKQAAIVLLALYPTVLLLNEILGRLLPDSIPYLLDVLIGLVLGVAILSWLLMPRLTRFLDHWLRN